MADGVGTKKFLKYITVHLDTEFQRSEKICKTK